MKNRSHAWFLLLLSAAACELSILAPGIDIPTTDGGSDGLDGLDGNDGADGNASGGATGNAGAGSVAETCDESAGSAGEGGTAGAGENSNDADCVAPPEVR